MLDLTLVNGRYYPVKLKYTIQDGKKEIEKDLILDLEPCKLKTIRKFQRLAKNAGEADLVEIMLEILNKNKGNIKVTEEMIEELSIDQMQILLIEYFNWIAKEKSNNPN